LAWCDSCGIQLSFPSVYALLKFNCIEGAYLLCRICCASKLGIAAPNIAPLQGNIVVGPLEVRTTKTEEVSDEERSLKEKFVGGWVCVMRFAVSSDRL
jgi:hypothetical protein